MNNRKIASGILAGAAVGVALGILLAPDKGSITRKKISKRGQEYAEELQQKFNDFIQNLTNKFESLKEEAVSVSETGKMKSKDKVAEVVAAELQ